MALQVNKTIEREQLKDVLELDAVPRAVDERLAALYEQLPDTLPTRAQSDTKAKRYNYKPFRVAAASAAAFVVLSFGTLCAFPAFASTLPVIGGIFRAFNTYQEGDNVQESREYIQNNSQPVDGVYAVAKAAKEGEKDVSITLNEAYYDGSYVFIGLEAKADVDADVYDMHSYDTDIYINGECQTAPDGNNIRNSSGYAALTPNDYSWQRTEDGRWINERSFRVPEKFRGLDSLELRIVFKDGLYITEEVEGDPNKMITTIVQTENEDGTYTETAYEAPAGYYDDDGNFHAENDYIDVPVNSSVIDLSLTVTKTADASARVIEGNGLEMGGVKLESVTISPVAAEFMIEYPDIYNNPATGAYFEDGKELGCLEETEPVKTESGEKYARIFSGIGEGETRRVVYAVYDKNNTNEFVAVFIVDPVSGTVTTGTAADVPDTF